MPSLSATLNQKKLVRGPDGQLTEETPEEVQSLSAKAGLASPPITPLGAQMIGANPHQAKMAGAPNQKAAALTIAGQQQTGQSLADAIRQGQGNERTQATSTEAAGMQKSQELQALGGLGDRVGKFIDAQRAQMTAAQPVEVQAAQKFNGRDITQLKPLLAQLRANPGDMNLQLQINQALGYDVNQQLAPEQINDLYDSAVTAISKGGAGSVDSDLTVSDLVAQGDFPYDAAELAHLLGVTEDQASAMSIGQIRDKVAEVQANEFSTTNQLEAQAQSGQLGSAERALARGAAREASRTGIRSSEADVANLEQQIAAADQVSFGGQIYSVEDLLSDDTISGIISDYLNSAPGSETRKQLEATEPQLMQFINKNEALLHDASQALSTGAQQFQGVQSSNQALLQNLPENLRTILAPQGGQLQAGALESKPLMQWAQQNPQAVQSLQGVSPEDAQALSGLSTEELNALEIGQPGGKFDQYQQNRTRVSDLKQRAAQVTSPDEIVDLLFGGSGTESLGQISGAYAGQQRAAALGLPNSANEYAALDSDGDGRVDSPDQLLESYKQRLGSYSLTDALAGTQPGNPTLQAPGDATTNWNPNQKSAYKQLRGALDDGTVDTAELASSRLNSDQMMSLDWNAPAFAKSKGALLQSTAQKAQEEVLQKYDLDSLDGLQKAYSDMLGSRTSLSKALSRDHGVSGSHVQEAYVDQLRDLSSRIAAAEKREAGALAAKEKARTDFRTVQKASKGKNSNAR